jgi:hypothetical protein
MGARTVSRGTSTKIDPARGSSASRLVPAVMLIAVGVAIGLAIGSIGRSEPKLNAKAVEGAAVETSTARAPSPVPRGKPWNAVVATHELPAKPDPSDEEAVRTYRAEQAKLVVKGLRSLGVKPEARRFPSVLAASTQVWPYVEGWMSAIQTVSPEVLEDVGNEIEASLCDPATQPIQQMLLVRMGEHDPLFVSQRGLGCTVERYTKGGGTADHVLWKALESWKDANLPVTPELEQLARAQGDERTLDLIGRIRGDIVQEPAPPPMTPEEEAHLEATAPPPEPPTGEEPPREFLEPVRPEG